MNLYGLSGLASVGGDDRVMFYTHINRVVMENLDKSEVFGNTSIYKFNAVVFVLVESELIEKCLAFELFVQFVVAMYMYSSSWAFVC